VILGHMVPTGTGFRDHYRTRVKKNIDFGEIGSGSGYGSSMDAELDELFGGGGIAGAGALAPTGSDGMSSVPSEVQVAIAEPEAETPPAAGGGAAEESAGEA